MCKWNDNAIVTIASNHETHLPLQQATGRVKNIPKALVQQPYLVHRYNEGMNGVDLMDRHLAKY